MYSGYVRIIIHVFMFLETWSAVSKCVRRDIDIHRNKFLISKATQKVEQTLYRYIRGPDGSTQRKLPYFKNIVTCRG